MKKYFLGSFVFIFIGVSIAFFWGGWSALVLTILLGLLEIALSFDNAILNASVLQKMTQIWQERFYTWGIFIAVFLTRLILPILIVAVSAKLSLSTVIKLAINSPEEYKHHLNEAHFILSTFGGLFLIQVFLSFFLNQFKKKHWLKSIESVLIRLGNTKYNLFFIALCILFFLQYFMPAKERVEISLSGGFAIVLFALLDYATHFLSEKKVVKSSNGIIPFLYLETLDASFSLDGVISAFAITTDLVVIFIGLSIGAIFVRAITIFLVEKGSIKRFTYLEHGAYYVIGFLGSVMLTHYFISIPGIVTALVCLSILVASFFSSIRD